MARVEFSADEFIGEMTQSQAPNGLFELGIMFSTGRDVDTDLVAAHKWFNLAAMRGNKSAREYRMEIASEMSSAQIAEAQKLAREWLQKS